MLHRRLFIGFVLLSLNLFAQQSNIDSLTSVLKTEKEDTNKVKTLTNLCNQLRESGKNDKALTYANQALNLSAKLNYDRGSATALDNVAIINYSNGNYFEALGLLDKALRIAEKLGDENIEAATYNDIGLVYDEQNNFPEALKNYLHALSLIESKGDKKQINKFYNNIGAMYYEESNLPEALKYFRLSLQIRLELKNDKEIGRGYNNLANVYSDEKMYDSAFHYYFMALALKQKTNDRRGEASTYNNIGTLYGELGKFDEAIDYHTRSLKIKLESGDKKGTATSYLNLGGLYITMQKNKEAADCMQKGLALAEEVGSAKLIEDFHLSQAKLDSSNGDFKNAFAEYKNYTKYHDSIENQSNTKKLVSEQMQYEFNKKQAEEKAIQDKKDAEEQANRKKQQIITGAISLGLLLVLIFSGLLLNRFRITRRQKRIIEEQKVIVEEKNKEILDSITYAKRLQDAILPPLSVIKKYIPDSFLLYKPKDIVAGDFYWMEKEGDIILIAACDCTGHGVPGAMVSVVCSNALNRALKEFKIRDTGLLLDKVRELVLETFEKSEGEVKDGMDCSFCAIDIRTNKVEWSGAYNPLWYIQNGEMKEIIADKQPIGKVDTPKPFSTHVLHLQKGDTLYLFTDGYADQFGGPKGKKFKYKQLQELIVNNARLAMEEQGRILNQTLEAWKGNLEQVDDLLLIGIRV